MSDECPTRHTVKNSHGEPIAADPKGNNVAFSCQSCGHPILAHAARNASGHFQDHPVEQVECIDCKASYFVRKKDGIFVITYKGPA